MVWGKPCVTKTFTFSRLLFKKKSLIQIGNLKFHLAFQADFRDEEDHNLCHLPPAFIEDRV